MRKISLWILPAMMILCTGIARADERAEFRSEVFADGAREGYQSSLINEERIGEYQLEKTIVDVHGQRVRIEEYLLRPKPEQIQFLTLNTRANRFDYGYQILTFGDDSGSYDVRSKSLEELGMSMWMSWGEISPEYWLTNCDMRVSNTIDQVDVNMTMGKPVQIEIKLPPFDEGAVIAVDGGSEELASSDERILADGETGEEMVMPESFFVYLPSSMNGEVSINGKLKETFSENTSADGKITITEEYIAADNTMKKGAEYTYSMMSGDEPTTYSDSDVLPEYTSSDFGDMACYSDKTTYKDGTWVNYEEYLIDDQGKVLSWNDFGYLPVEGTEDGEIVEDGQDVQIAVPDYLFQQPNREMIISASEFDGRTIDLVIAPMQGPDGMPVDMFMW